MEQKGSNIRPFEIYFEDRNGARIPADGADVCVTIPDFGNEPTAFSLNESGSARELSVRSEAGQIRFETDGSRYYVLAEEIEAETPSETSPSPGSSSSSAEEVNGPDAPILGIEDISRTVGICLITAGAVIMAAAAVLVCIGKKHKK